MKNWYIETTVRYTYSENNKIIVDTEGFSFVIQSSSENKAKETAKKESINKLTNMVDDVAGAVISIDDCYETSDDARAQ